MKITEKRSEDYGNIKLDFTLEQRLAANHYAFVIHVLLFFF